VTFTKVPTIYHSWVYPFHHSPLFPSTPVSSIVSTGLIFPFSYTNTWYFHHIHSPTPFSCILPPPKKCFFKKLFFWGP
jgi:hypothetical protein